MTRTISYSEAIREALTQEMDRDESVVLFGQGIDDFKGFYGTTLGLQDKFGKDRVFDTPLAEDAMTGLAIGAAYAGLRPILTHIRMDFALLTMNQLINIAAKSHYMYGGTVHVPIVVRSVIGRSWGQGAQHSQGLYSFFMHVPGLKVVAPTTPYDAKGCMLESIRDDNPVMFVEHRMIHFQKGFVPENDYTVPFGKARILNVGEDVTIVGISFMAVESMRACSRLADKGISAEIIDPVSLSPLDIETIAESVRKTGRLLVVDNGWTMCGAGAEIVAQVLECLQHERSILVRRLGFLPVPCPTTKNLENEFYPDAQKIASAAYQLVTNEQWMPEMPEAPEIVVFKGPF